MASISLSTLRRLRQLLSRFATANAQARVHLARPDAEFERHRYRTHRKQHGPRPIVH